MGTARGSILARKTGGAAPAVALVLWQMGSAAGQAPEMQFAQLPNGVRDYAKTVRQSCKALDPTFKAYDAMQGITASDLGGAPALFVDAEQLCNSWMKGANCSNRGCDLKIWKNTGQRSWKKIFDEHLYRKFISLGEDNRFRLMAVSVFAGSPHCGPVWGKDYTSGQSCDALVHYQNNHWVWKKIK